MKVYGEVLEVRNCGDRLAVTLQGKQLKAADWQPVLKWSIELPMSSVVCKTYTVGRVIEFEVRP